MVFGVTVAGRPAELAGVERMVGLFINTLPLRVGLSPGQPVHALLRQLQERQSGLLAHQHVGLAEIQQLAGVGELFDSCWCSRTTRWTARRLAGDGCGGLRLARVRGHDATHYPLSLMVQPGERLQLRLDYRADLFERGSVAVLGERLVRLLAAAVADPERRDRRRLRCCRRRARAIAGGLQRHGAAGCGGEACRSCLRRRPAARRRRWRWCARSGG